jgi:hypothetical protein
MAMKSRNTLPGNNESSALIFQLTYYENLQIPRYQPIVLFFFLLASETHEILQDITLFG